MLTLVFAATTWDIRHRVGYVGRGFVAHLPSLSRHRIVAPGESKNCCANFQRKLVPDACGCISNSISLVVQFKQSHIFQEQDSAHSAGEKTKAAWREALWDGGLRWSLICGGAFGKSNSREDPPILKHVLPVLCFSTFQRMRHLLEMQRSDIMYTTVHGQKGSS